MGLMLETVNTELLAPGAAHDNAPDKVPAKRLRTIEEAGKQCVPFTTGLLIGIRETPEDRVETLLAIRGLHERYGHIQEVIVQNFRAKPSIPMADAPEPSQGEMLRTVAVARLLMPNVNIQAPPNLNAPYYEELLHAGINDWGGISRARDFNCASDCRSIPNSCHQWFRNPDFFQSDSKTLTTAKALPIPRGPHDLCTHRRHRRGKVRRWSAASDPA
jgi:7,8-didemethyl-8-hydroxy-5-deazariboflavin synthase CofG subunit